MLKKSSSRTHKVADADGRKGYDATVEEQHFVDDFVPYLLNQATNAMNQRFKRSLKSFNISHPQWRVLAILNSTNGLSLTDIASLTSIDQPTLSRIVDQMEEKKLVKRAARADDARFISISLTRAGRDRYRDIWPTALEHGQRAMSDFTKDEEDLLRSLIKRFLKNVVRD